MGFYCYNCGAEVQRTSSSCPVCMVVFEGVKCPSCGFSGKASLFKKGCPRCFYKIREGDKTGMELPEKVRKKEPFPSRERRPFLSFLNGRLSIILSLVLGFGLFWVLKFFF